MATIGCRIDQLAATFASEPGPQRSGGWREIREYTNLVTRQDLSVEQFAQHYAITLVSIVIARQLSGVVSESRVWNWLRGPSHSIWPVLCAEAEEVEREIFLTQGESLAFEQAALLEAFGPDRDRALMYFFEALLGFRQRSQRKKRGVYLTPRPLADFMVRSLNEVFRDKFELNGGWADLGCETDAGCPFRVLDPACGTGVFLREILNANAEALQGESREEWSRLVSERVLPNLIGFEILLPAVAIARLQMADALARRGFDFATPGEPAIYLTNTLAQPFSDEDFQRHPFEDRLRQTESVRLSDAISVVVGNPPFSGLSENRNPWIEGLLRGHSEGDFTAANYYATDSGPLIEKKLWLNDDYIKFFSFAQWRISRQSLAAICFVSNHGYLDAATFRGMRYQLQRDFPFVAIVDLHGSVKKKELARESEQNIFDIESGVAVGTFVRTSLQRQETQVLCADIWGSRRNKGHELATQRIGTLEEQTVVCTPPFYLFVPRDHLAAEEYDRGWPLTDVMPVHSTAAVTARDRFVIATKRVDLLDRLNEFVDPSISEDDLRARYFGNTRSSRYPSGDTRGWKLQLARESLRRTDTWRKAIRECWYRPFDKRFILWTPEMIDWPRSTVMNHLTEIDNLAIVTRRQMCPGQPRNFFYVADDVVIDGLIRSDNRGTESFFPLYLADSDGGTSKVNVDDKFLNELAECLDGSDGINDLPGKILYYFYAAFHDRNYRERFADQLVLEFPRVFLPASRVVFERLAELGEELITLQLLRFASPDLSIHGDAEVESGYPKWHDERLWLNKGCYVEHVAEAVWNYGVGSYPVLSKWLKERRGTCLGESDRQTLAKIISAAAGCLSAERRIGDFVDSQGGWTACFRA